MTNTVDESVFKVRNMTEINTELGASALPNDFCAIPVFLYLNPTTNDDASTYGCPFINEVGDDRAADPSVWTKYDGWRREVTEPIHESLNVTLEEEKNDDFHSFQILTDTAVAENFEGIINETDYFTREEWDITNEFQRAWLVDDYSDNARDLMISRLLRKPLDLMKQRVTR